MLILKIHISDFYYGLLKKYLVLSLYILFDGVFTLQSIFLSRNTTWQTNKLQFREQLNVDSDLFNSSCLFNSVYFFFFFNFFSGMLIVYSNSVFFFSLQFVLSKMFHGRLNILIKMCWWDGHSSLEQCLSITCRLFYSNSLCLCFYVWWLQVWCTSSIFIRLHQYACILEFKSFFLKMEKKIEFFFIFQFLKQKVCNCAFLVFFFFQKSFVMFSTWYIFFFFYNLVTTK